MDNIYLPHAAVIKSIKQESPDTRTYKVVLADRATAGAWTHLPGQFVQISLPGAGEVPISIASAPEQRGYLEFTIRSAGKVTREIAKLKKGNTLFLRGPYGNAFPLEEVKGRDLYFLAGGIGLPPLRSVINSVLARREEFGKVKVLYGAKEEEQLCFTGELRKWAAMHDIEVLLTVDSPCAGWEGNVGVVTSLCDKADLDCGCGVAFVCGPPAMIRFAVEKLGESGFPDHNIFITLERYMKCGVGKCGHCTIGGTFVCTDGPVFSYRELKKMPEREGAL